MKTTPADKTNHLDEMTIRSFPLTRWEYLGPGALTLFLSWLSLGWIEAFPNTLSIGVTSLAISWLPVALRWLRRQCTQYVLTTERMRTRTGILSLKSEDVDRVKMESVDYSQSLLGRIFGFGDVTITATGGKAITIKNVLSPAEAQAAVAQKQ